MKPFRLYIDKPADIELVARSQAKELLTGMEQHTVVELDFNGVEQISR